jgi:hypothetical protein
MNIHSIEYLSNHSFIRNYSIENFVRENNFQIELSNYTLYSVGIIQNIRIVHMIKILGQCPSAGVTSYYIEWFNVASFSVDELIYKSEEIQSCSFWVHSGVALRKNFFLFEDRMSLFKSTFLFDPRSKCHFRLAILQPYLKINSTLNIHSPMFSSPCKIFLSGHRKNKATRPIKNYKLHSLQKNLKKVLKLNNTFSYLEQSHPRLFEEITKIINL